jgi:Flp pilus assembly protein TadG
MKEDRGSLAAEAVILLPCFMLLLLLVVYAGRMTLTATQIQHVAETAARSASRESLQNAQRQAVTSARREIQRLDIECQHARIDAQLLDRESLNAVRVTVMCSVPTGDLGLLRIPSLQVHGSSLSVIDRYRKQ